MQLRRLLTLLTWAAPLGGALAAQCSEGYAKQQAVQLLQLLFDDEKGFTLPSRDTSVFLLSTASTLATIANARSSKVATAKQEMYTLMDAQLDSGRVPEYTCVEGCGEFVGGTLFPGDAYWGSNSSGISAIPFHSTAVANVHSMSSDSTFLGTMYPQLLQFHEYLHTQRVDCNGNVVVLHPWETLIGEASSLWSGALQSVIEHVDDTGFTVDIPASVKTLPNYPGDEVYTAEMYLVECLAEHGSELAGYIANCGAPFAMLDAEYLSVLYQADMDLLRLAHAANDDGSKNKIEKWIDQDAAALSQLYDSSRSLYVNKLVMFPEGDFSVCEYSSLGQSVAPEQVSFATPLFTGVASKSQATAVADRLMSRKAGTGFFCVDTPYSAETCGSEQDKAVWMQHNILLAAGLQATEQGDFASWVRNMTFTLVCNVTGAVGDTEAHGSVFPRVFDGSTGRPMADMYGEQSAIAAAVTVVFDNIFEEDDDDHKPPVGHDVIFALIIVALSIAFSIGASCFLFSYNLLRNLKDTDASPALSDIRPAPQQTSAYEDYGSIGGGSAAGSRSPTLSTTEYRQFGAQDDRRLTSTTADASQNERGWWPIIAPYAQYLRLW